MTSGVRHTVPLALYTSDAGDVIATRHGRRLESDFIGRRSGVPDVNEGTLSVRTRDVMVRGGGCLLYTSPSPRDMYKSRMPSSA